MPSPTITFVGIGGVLKTITTQGMQHAVLNGFNRGREIGDVMMWIGIQRNHDGIREKCGEQLAIAAGVKNHTIDARQMIKFKTADGSRRSKDCFGDAPLVQSHQRTVAFLHLDDAVLNGHGRMMAGGGVADNVGEVRQYRLAN